MPSTKVMGDTMKVLFVTVACAAAITSTAANAEGYVELRSGMAFGPDVTTESIGLAAGYDADIGSGAFIGAELTADTNSSFDTPVYGLNLRVGGKTGEASKLYATAGIARYEYAGFISLPSYSLFYSGWDTDFVAGAGYQHKIGNSTRLSVQYQRYFDTQYNRASVGIGFEF